MTVDPVANGATTASNAARQTLAGNFDTFLTMLTAQLQNQDPLSPMDSTQFTQQLVQFSQVEQQIETNDTLGSILAQNQASAAALPLSYLGHSAVVQSPKANLAEDSPARWTYTLPTAADRVTLTIKDASGRIVHTATGDRAAGSHAFTWDGDINGAADAPPGTYTLSISARDSEDKAIAATIHVVEKITGVDMSGAAPRVLTASGLHDLAEIIGVYA
ncbi:MAG: flagellar hook assembly protein FlgD [Hyphomonadaceae bacterium]|nr:flagellar hook assembly protein FlgD [Hyphomonadaceae bacterium]